MGCEKCLKRVGRISSHLLHREMASADSDKAGRVPGLAQDLLCYLYLSSTPHLFFSSPFLPSSLETSQDSLLSSLHVRM